MRRTISILAPAMAALVVVAGAWTTEHAEAQEGSPPAPERILRGMADFYQGLQGFRVKVHRTLRAEFQGRVEDLDERMALAARRPNRLAWRVNNGQGLDVLSDGANLTFHDVGLRRYTQEKAPASFQELSIHPLLAEALGDGSFFLKLLADDPCAAVSQGAGSIRLAGKETVGGRPSWRLKFVGEAIDWDLWIAADDQPVVTRVARDLTRELAAEGAPADGVKLTSTLDFTDWRVSVQDSAEAFAFRPPAGSHKVDSLAPEEPEAAAMAMVGKPAPRIAAKLVGGGHFSLADQYERGIVILDFWATTCGPCAKTMPKLAEAAALYEDKGVTLFAINQGESERVIAEFLRKTKLDVPVVLDPDLSISLAYQVEAVPMLVLVDAEGIARSVHVGSRPDLVERLKEELNGLLASEDVAAPRLKTPASRANNDH